MNWDALLVRQQEGLLSAGKAVEQAVQSGCSIVEINALIARENVLREHYNKMLTLALSSEGQR